VDCVVALEVGADDYLPRTVDRHEVLARIKALLRRVSSNCTHDLLDEELRAGNLVVDLVSRRALLNDQELQLNLRELDLLVYGHRLNTRCSPVSITYPKMKLMGSVNIQAVTMFPATPQWTERAPRTAPTPMIADEIA